MCDFRELDPNLNFISHLVISFVLDDQIMILLYVTKEIQGYDLIKL